MRSLAQSPAGIGSGSKMDHVSTKLTLVYSEPRSKLVLDSLKKPNRWLTFDFNWLQNNRTGCSIGLTKKKQDYLKISLIPLIMIETYFLWRFEFQIFTIKNYRFIISLRTTGCSRVCTGEQEWIHYFGKRENLLVTK